MNILYAALVCAVFFGPIAASAQSLDDWRGWFSRGNSELAQKINALPATAVVSLPIPILFGVAPSNLTRNFGDPRDGGARTHEGLDIMAPKDTPIVSPTDAVVIDTGYGDSAGYNVYAAAPGGETHVYMHLSRVGEGVERGKVLSRGDLIGYVGNTGNAAGGATHLHFEIKNNGAQDPYPRLTQEFSLAEKMASLNKIFAINADPSLAATLVQNFKSVFTSARTQGIALPSQITSLIGGGTAVTPPAPAGTSPQIAALLTQIQILQAQLAALQGGAVPVIAFSRDLRIGSTGADVKSLQVYLNTHGFLIASSGAGSLGQETTYFGPATKAALAKYQASKGINPASGFFGPLTRATLV